jgi:uncharacterized protein (DUF2147 family)
LKKLQSNTIDNNNDNDDITVEVPEFQSIFNFDREEACYKNQWIDEKNKLEYQRWIPIEQTRWENWKAKVVDPKNGKYYTSGEGTGRCLGKEGPKRYVTSIIRLKTGNDGAEYCQSPE